jgi:integrase
MPLAQERGKMRRRRFQRGGLSKRKRNGRLYWYLQWREDGQPKSKELGLVSDITRANAEIMRAAIMEPINAGVVQTAKPAFTFEQFIEAVYLPVALRRWKASTAMTTDALIRAHLLPAFGSRLLTDIRREDLQALLDRTAFSGRSRSVVDHLRWQLRSIFRLAMGDGLITVDPTLGLSTPRCAKAAGEKRVMSGSDVQRALRVLPIRERLIFRLATIEGMRPGEILGLQLQDMGEQSVKVARRVYEGDVDSPKTGRSRVVGLSPATASLLAEWRGLLRDQRPEAWLFQSENLSSPLNRDNVQRRYLQPRLAKIGLGWVTFQVMRRTNGSLAHKLGIDPKAAADQRGHGVGVAMNEYIQSDLEQKLQVAKTLDFGIVQ